MSNDIYHIGTKRHSGRYPWGSGKDPKSPKSLLRRVREMEAEGIPEKEIALALNSSTTRIRELKSIEKAEKRAADSAFAFRLKEKGYSHVAIGKRMGINESSVRSLLDPILQERNEVIFNIADALKKEVGTESYLDIGSGTEVALGVSPEKLKSAVRMLIDAGYVRANIQVEQQGTGKYTTVRVLAPPGTAYKDLYRHTEKIKAVGVTSDDGGRTMRGLGPIKSVDSKRIYVKHVEEGGADRDGLIELRPGVEDLSLGKNRYAQVRISVNGTHYMKGMAVYSNDIPDGYDIVYNSNKPKTAPFEKVFKPYENDPDNPFGATIKGGAAGQRGALNIVNEAGDWMEWSKTLSSQVLSKQMPPVAKKQLDEALQRRKEDFDEINQLTNPAIKRKLLEDFAESSDAAAVHLKAAALPRQSNHVILPFPGMKENEVYAPGFKDGEPVVLIRHPHGGIFEIPELIVNNRYKKARETIGSDAPDAIGIHPNVAKVLSGADFDGDTVLVIPNRDRHISTKPPIKALMEFDPKSAYPQFEGMKVMSEQSKGLRMGDVSNLITDMTIKGATREEITRAVRHSMVVIDAAKHKLNYKQSYIDNGIAQLKEKYQGSKTGGAATLISKAKSEERVNQRTDRYVIDPITGNKTYFETGKTFVDRSGKTKPLQTKSTKMAETRDARTLSSGTIMEGIYADYANAVKGLANKARLRILATKDVIYDPNARNVYKKEVEELKAQLALAKRNAPRERAAQLLANRLVSEKRRANPDMKKEDLKKLKAQQLAEARRRMNAQGVKITFTEEQYKAIQAGAVTSSFLQELITRADNEHLRSIALPRTMQGMSDARRSRALAMLEKGHTNAEVAEALGVSVSTLLDSVKP